MVGRFLGFFRSCATHKCKYLTSIRCCDRSKVYVRRRIHGNDMSGFSNAPSSGDGLKNHSKPCQRAFVHDVPWLVFASWEAADYEIPCGPPKELWLNRSSAKSEFRQTVLNALDCKRVCLLLTQWRRGPGYEEVEI